MNNMTDSALVVVILIGSLGLLLIGFLTLIKALHKKTQTVIVDPLIEPLDSSLPYIDPATRNGHLTKRKRGRPLGSTKKKVSDPYPQTN